MRTVRIQNIRETFEDAVDDVGSSWLCDDCERRGRRQKKMGASKERARVAAECYDNDEKCADSSTDNDEEGADSSTDNDDEGADSSTDNDDEGADSSIDNDEEGADITTDNDKEGAEIAYEEGAA